MNQGRYRVIGLLRDELSNRQIRELKQLYKGVLRSLNREEARLKRYGQSSSARAIQIQELRSLTVSLLSNVSNAVYDRSQRSVQQIVKATADLYGAHSGIVQAVTASFIDGSVYGGTWSLSESIWGANSKQVRDVYNIVARGNLLGYSFEDIADQLKKYVDPSKLYEWDGPGSLHVTTRVIDYNAARLIRTLLTHAYQYAQWIMTHDDPGIVGYLWHAQGPRACQICRARDGRVYGIDEVPWDHPNGMCYIEPVYIEDDVLFNFGDFATREFIEDNISQVGF